MRKSLYLVEYLKHKNHFHLAKFWRKCDMSILFLVQNQVGWNAGWNGTTPLCKTRF